MMQKGTIIILGNGFDLNLNLPTKYSDFIVSEEFTNIDRSRKLFSYLSNISDESKKWVDIELELKKYADLLDSQNEQDIKEFKDDYNLLCRRLLLYLTRVADIDGYKMKVFDISSNKISYEIWRALENKYDKVYSFNYTLMPKYLLQNSGHIKYKDDNEVENIVQYVHGTIINKDIILGIDNDPKYEKFGFLYKSCKCNFSMEITKSMFETNRIVILGHSLGITDEMYFKSL